jgi:hypothetical protein
MMKRMAILLIASPHRYPDLARLWHRFVMRDLVPAFARLHLEVQVNIFCDANAGEFRRELFPGVWFSESGPGMRDFMEFYDGTLQRACDFLLFLDADTFFLDGEWAASQFEEFRDPQVAAISFVPRKAAPAIFALLCRVESYRPLAAPVFACRYEFPEIWPEGVNLQPGDFAARELLRSGNKIVNFCAEEAWQHIAKFRGTTGIRASREQITHAVGEKIFLKSVVEDRACLVAAYDNLLLGCLYEALFGEPFACDGAGVALGGSMTLAELSGALEDLREGKLLEELRERFQLSRRNILRMAEQEGIALEITALLSEWLGKRKPKVLHE